MVKRETVGEVFHFFFFLRINKRFEEVKRGRKSYFKMKTVCKEIKYGQEKQTRENGEVR